MSQCTVCGRSADSHNRNVRFRLPDPVLRLPDRDAHEGTWKSEDDPNIAVMMQVPDLGAFVRALLPVRLSQGHTITFGVWVGIDPDELQRVFKEWWAPEYPELTFHGHLANALPAWEVFGAPVSLAVLDPDATPYCVATTDPVLHEVLTREWDHEPVLSALP